MECCCVDSLCCVDCHRFVRLIKFDFVHELCSVVDVRLNLNLNLNLNCVAIFCIYSPVVRSLYVFVFVISTQVAPPCQVFSHCASFTVSNNMVCPHLLVTSYGV
jgi:hypothetical protein